MKNIGLISLAAFLAISFSNNLLAGPIYAVKLKRKTPQGEQEVFLYGDQHDTHKANKTNKGNEEREQKYSDTFCAELKKAKTKTLVLCEDHTFSPCDEIYSDQESEVAGFGSLKTFIKQSTLVAHALSSQQNQGFSKVQVKSIDPRTKIHLITLAIKHCTRKYYHNYTVSEIEVFKKAYDRVKDWNITKVFDEFINNIKSYAQFTSNGSATKIFDEIANTIQMRKKLLGNKIVHDTKLSPQELDQATVATIAADVKKDDRWNNFVHWIFQNADPLVAYYGFEAVEAEALWQILTNPSSNIVVIAGVNHIDNLEQYLEKLGFEKCDQAGQNFHSISQEEERLLLSFNNILVPDYAQCVFPLSPFDRFGRFLYDFDFQQEFKEFFSHTDENKCQEAKQAYSNLEDARKKLNAFNPIPLVPLETFKWISGSTNDDITPTKKRARGGDTPEQEPKTKKRRLTTTQKKR